MNSYLEKHRFCEGQIDAPMSGDVNIIIVIPCYNEPNILKALFSLHECGNTVCSVEIIVVINSGENDDNEISKQNQRTIEDVHGWGKKYNRDKLILHVIHQKGLPKKHAGVGLARKIGMDEAVARFDAIKNDNGIIVCLDADCIVEKNYLEEIEKHFLKHPKTTGCSVYYEHPIEGSEFDKKVYTGIINYELFLRYYNRALHFCHFPYAFHTIGSCMAVRSSIYQKQGGMNRRKAGEDFYFLHKIFPLRKFTELNTTRVIPSSRESNRVPFGTGSAVKKFMLSGTNDYMAYNIQTFIDLKMFFDAVSTLFCADIDTFSLPVKFFLAENDFETKLSELRQHTNSEKSFVKRFFNWFDGFMVLKFVHYARDHHYAQMEIGDAAAKLASLCGKKFQENISKKELLLEYRKWERD